MQKKLILVILGAGAALLDAQTFKSRPVNIPGGSDILVTGINDSEVMVANYTDSAGTNHCEMISGSTVTQIVDPNEQGTGAGKGTSCYGINNSAQIIGTYSFGVFGNGFLYSGGTYSDVIVPTATAGTSAYGLNNSGEVVGSFADNVGQHGFIYTVATQAITTLNVPNASATLAIGINDNNIVTFEWVDSQETYHGAIWKNGDYTIINYPGATETGALGINNKNYIVISVEDSAGAWQAYMLAGGKYYPCNATGAANTYAFGINSKEVMVGGYNPASAPTTQVGYVGDF